MLNPFVCDKSKEISINPTIIAYTIAAVLMMIFLHRIQKILLLFYLSFIIMLAINPLILKLQKLKFPRMLAVIVAYLISALFLLLVIAIGLPPLIGGFLNFIKTMDIPWLQQGILGNNLAVDELGNSEFDLNKLADMAGTLGDSINTIINLIGRTFNSIFTVVTIFIISLYLSVDRKNLHLKLFWFTKEKHIIKQAKNFLDTLESHLGGWVRGELILMTVIGVMTYVGLLIIGVKYALPLAVIAFLLEILPNLGPMIAAVPAVAIPLLNQNYIVAVTVLVFYILVQQVENHFIVPRVMKTNADVNPLVAILSILIGFELSGPAGAFLAIPTYIILRTAYSIWWNKNHCKVAATSDSKKE